MIGIFSIMSSVPSRSCPAGCDTDPRFTEDSNGDWVRAEPFNRYEDMQCHVDDFNIERIIQRFVAGDSSMLRPCGCYGDFTDSPQTRADALILGDRFRTLESTLGSEDYSLLKDGKIDEFVEKHQERKDLYSLVSDLVDFVKSKEVSSNE